jgi:hypothetical protein
MSRRKRRTEAGGESSRIGRWLIKRRVIKGDDLILKARIRPLLMLSKGYTQGVTIPLLPMLTKKKKIHA